jgi:hypothetical protein
MQQIELNPIQQATVPQLVKAKQQAIQKGDTGGAALLGAMEFAITDPKKFKRFLNDLSSILD